MRITSSTYSNILLNSSQSLQQSQAQIQTEVSTGYSVQSPSDSPVAYDEATQALGQVAQLSNYSATITQATSTASQNNQAMVSLHNIISQAGELATSVNGTLSTTDAKDVGAQMSSLLTELTSIANQKDSAGNYLFGGTSNQQPLDPATQAYNSSTNNQGASVDVQPGLSVQTGILAGRPGSPAVSGFLYNASTGVDVVSALKNAISDLNSGNINAVQNTDVSALNNALDNISQYVGSTSATLSAISTASTNNQQQSLTLQQQVGALTQVNVPNALVQLQQTQLDYQASLEAGTKILGLSILNYYGSVPNF